MPRTDRQLTPGVDVASWQHKKGKPINWPVVAAQGYAFAIVKRSEGTDYKNPFFKQDWEGSKAAGLLRGVYHFAQPDSNSPKDEAKFFLDSLPELEVGDIVALDVEAGSGNLADWSLQWLRFVQEQLGFPPLFYSGKSFMESHGRTGNPDLAQFGLWFARYRSTFPPTPAVWPFVAIWQHTNVGQVDGIVADAVDLDFFNGPRDRFALYGKPAPARANERQPALEEVPPNSLVAGPQDTLRGIAEMANVKPEDLAQANADLNADQLPFGTLVTLPDAATGSAASGRLQLSGETYVTRGSTNLPDVAARLGMSLLALELANPQFADEQPVPLGTTLKLPASP